MDVTSWCSILCKSLQPSRDLMLIVSSSQWIFKGPVTRMFLRYLWSNIPVTSKVTTIAYIFTYYAIASGLLLTTVNYVMIGLFPDIVDHYYLPSWGIWLSLVIVFNVCSSLSFAMLRHKSKALISYGNNVLSCEGFQDGGRHGAGDPTSSMSPDSRACLPDSNFS